MKLPVITLIKLSKDFSLEEFIVSQIAERFGYDNTPNKEQVDNLRRLCKNVLQPLRDIINTPIIITSGFRSNDVNKAVGGKENSQHLEGKAADLIVSGLQLMEVFNLLRTHFPFDQLIYEFGKWIHVSFNGYMNRKSVLVSKRVKGIIVYEEFGNHSFEIK